MKLLYSLLLIILSGTSFSQVTNIDAGTWSDAALWSTNAVPTANDIVSLSFDIVIDINASCKALYTNGHTVTVNTGVNFNIAGYYPGGIADSTFTDPRDGQDYTYRHIGTQVWMTKNLNYVIPDSWCCGNNTSNCETYGRLYTWDAAMLSAPPGWHLPSDSEWTVLVNYLGGDMVAGGKMKTTTLWMPPNESATNSSGFSALPAGFGYANGVCNGTRVDGYWWSATQSEPDRCWYRGVDYNSAAIDRLNYYKFVGFSVRCIRD